MSKVLGELYKPKGLALETARAVLEVDEPYACNVAFGCLNECGYCYVPKVRHGARDFRLPKEPPVELVKKQDIEVEGVFLSFLTDPFLKQNRKNTEDLIRFLFDELDVIVATLSKIGTTKLRYGYIRQGMTIVSLDYDFWKRWEPNTTDPKARVELLRVAASCGGYTWLSMEPYPCSAIWKQKLEDLLEEIKFVDLIVFGKWNYDKRASTEQARGEYQHNVETLTDFCKSNNIRLHIKSDTLRFIQKGKGE